MTTYVYPMPINRTFVQTRLGLLALAVLTLGLPAWSGADEDPTSGVPAQAFQQSDSAESTAAFAVTSSAVLTDYLDAALVNNPAVISARSRVQALEHVAGQAGALPDLKLSWGEMLVPVETRVGPQQRVLSISQKIPWFGKLGLQRAQADLQTEAAAESWRSSVQQVIGDVRTNWYELARIRMELGLQRDLLVLARQEATQVTGAYETGEGSYADLMRSRMSLRRQEVLVQRLDDQLASQTIRLNVVVGLPLSTPTPPADLPGSPIWPGRSFLRDDLLALLEQHNPQLAARRLHAASREQGLDLAGKQGGPDFTLGVDYIMTGESSLPGVTDSGKDPVVARVAVNVPLWGGRVSAGRRAAASELTVARADVDRLRVQLISRFEDALFNFKAAADDLTLYDDSLLPDAGRMLAVAQAGYESGRVSFVEFLAARRHVLSLEIERIRAVAAGELALTELDRLLGGQLLRDVVPATLPEKDG